MKQELSNKDFSEMAVCSVRYCLGRKSYMPDEIRGIIEPRISTMETRALIGITKTLNQTWNPKDIDEEWKLFEAKIREELKARGQYC